MAGRSFGSVRRNQLLPACAQGSHRARLLISLAIACILFAACARTSTLPPATEASSARVPNDQPPMSTPLIGSTSTPAPAPTPTTPTGTTLPSAPAGFALIEGTVTDKSARALTDATLEYRPFGLVVRTDAAGRYRALLPIPGGGCVWTSIAVSAPGYGSLLLFDVPLSASSGRQDIQLFPGDVRHFVGPPAASGSGQAVQQYCTSGVWIPPSTIETSFPCSGIGMQPAGMDLSVCPWGGRAGDAVTLDGAGCGSPASQLPVSATLGQHVVDLGTVDVGADGTFRRRIVLPDIPDGTYQLRIGPHCGATFAVGS